MATNCLLQSGIILLPSSEDPTARPRHLIRLSRRSVPNVATVFVPQDTDATPEHRFPLQTLVRGGHHLPRFINRFDTREMLLVVDGACLGNGRFDPRPSGGCSFTYKSSTETALLPFVPSVLGATAAAHSGGGGGGKDT